MKTARHQVTFGDDSRGRKDAMAVSMAGIPRRLIAEKLGLTVGQVAYRQKKEQLYRKEKLTPHQRALTKGSKFLRYMESYWQEEATRVQRTLPQLIAMIPFLTHKPRKLLKAPTQGTKQHK